MIAFLSVLVMFYFSLRQCQLRFLFFTTIVVKYHIEVMFDPLRGFFIHGEYCRFLSITHLNDDFYAILEYILEF